MNSATTPPLDLPSKGSAVARNDNGDLSPKKQKQVDNNEAVANGNESAHSEIEETTNPQEPTFPQQWMDVIEKESTDPTAPRLKDESNKRLLEWLPNGQSFVIRDRSAFEREVLPRHYIGAQCKYMSFVRKLYRWGFRKVGQNAPGNDGTTFRHPHFKRGDKKLCLKMRSTVKKPAAKGLKAAGANANGLAVATMANHPGMGLLNMLQQQQQSQQSAGMSGSANNATDANSILFMKNLLARAEASANNAAAGGELNLNSAQAGGTAAQGLNRQGMFPSLNNNQMGSNFTINNLGGLTRLTAGAATTGTCATSSLSCNNNQGTQGQGVESGASGDITSSDLFEVGLQLKRMEEHQQQMMNMMYSNTFNTGPQRQQGLGRGRQQQQQQQQQQSPAVMGMGGMNTKNAVSSQGGVVDVAKNKSSSNFGQGMPMSSELEIASDLMNHDPRAYESKQGFGVGKGVW